MDTSESTPSASPPRSYNPFRAWAGFVGAKLLHNLNIGGKLTVAFGILIVLTLSVFALSYLGSQRAVTSIERTTDLRAPGTLASARAQANLRQMQSAVLGYLALGDQTYRDDYERAATAFAGNFQDLELLLHKSGAQSDSSSTSGEKIASFKLALAKWQELPPQLFDLRDDQLKREPAVRVLIKDANPLIASIVINTKSIMQRQQRREANRENMSLLEDLASFQTSFIAMVAGLRGYVTTKRDTFKYEYTSNLSINDIAWSNLTKKINLLEPSQKSKFEQIADQRKAFLTLPNQMITFVEGEHAREDLFLFRTEAVPLAEEMLRLLDEIAASEQDQLQRDLASGRSELSEAQWAIILGGVAALALGLILDFVFRENIAGPVERLTMIAERVREGDLSAHAEVESNDEIGHLAETFNRMTLRLADSLTILDQRRRDLETLSTKLSKYLSPQVYSSIFSGRQEVIITSTRKKLTIFFSDIANFTETTDSLESEQLTELLNSYLTEMSQIALQHGATIDKYVGDAMLVFFGDPESRGIKEDALACVEMAIAMQRRMRDLRDEWLGRGLEQPFELRIGINTGYCTVGNFGSEDRMDYTIIGGEVNLAARLQSKAEPGGILLAHETYSLVKDHVHCTERDPIQVKGFAKPVRNYAVTNILEVTKKASPESIKADERGFKLRVRFDELDGADRAKAIRIMEDVLARLKK